MCLYVSSGRWINSPAQNQSAIVVTRGYESHCDCLKLAGRSLLYALVTVLHPNWLSGSKYRLYRLWTHTHTRTRGDRGREALTSGNYSSPWPRLHAKKLKMATMWEEKNDDNLFSKFSHWIDQVCLLLEWSTLHRRWEVSLFLVFFMNRGEDSN